MRKEMKILVLDDDENRQDWFKRELIGYHSVHVYTAKDCIRELNDNDYDMVFLDHDLGGYQMVESGEETGWEVAKWLSENKHRKPEKVIIHSLNPSGAKNMQSLMVNSMYIPITTLMTGLGKYIRL